MSGFSALNTAISGLTAAQRAVEVTSQNIANANTPGYTRQRIMLSSVGSTTAAHFHTGNNVAILGGVKVDAVLRVRDAFLETARVNAGATKEALGIRAAKLSGVEGLLNEPSDNGLQAVVDDFFSAWHELATNPGTSQGAAAGQVIQAANAVVAQLRFVSSGIEEQWTSARSELAGTVGELNQATSDLAAVNKYIIEGAVADHPINELLDRRDSLVRTIGELAGGRAVIATNGTASVMINNITVVAGLRSVPITVAGATSIGDATTDPPTLMSGEVGIPVSGGKLAGLLASLGSDIPIVSAQLDGAVTALRDAVNIVHSTGYTTEGETGLNFFSGTSARDLGVIPTSSADLALSASAGVVDGSNAEKIADLSLDDRAAEVLDGPGPSIRLRLMAADIGTKLQGLTMAVEVQESVFATADAAINSDSGVSIDEEMTSLLMYQRSYQASARVISTVDELLDTLINRMAA